MGTKYEHFIRRYPPNRRSRRSEAELNSSTDAQAAAAAAAALASVGGAGKKLPTSAQLANLQAAWEVRESFPEASFRRESQMQSKCSFQVSRRVSKEDWLDWYNRLCSELLKASPSPALRACWKVAQRHSQLAKDLFNASFVSCWTELDVLQQDELMRALEQGGNSIAYKSYRQFLAPF